MAKKEYLSAEISVEDKATKQLDRIVESVEKQTVELLKMQKASGTTGKEMDKMTKSVLQQNNQILKLKATLDKTRRSSQKKMEVRADTRSAERSVDRLTRSFDVLRTSASKANSMIGSVRSGLSRLNPLNLRNLLLAAGGTYAGKQVFDNTVGAAADYEMSTKVIQAMFGDPKKAKKYVNTMQNVAIKSPLLNSQDIFMNSKSYISLTKNQNQLNKMWNLTERLLAVDPAQGVEGAVFGLRELFSGDSKSLAERFELSKTVLNGIKKMPLDQQLKALDKYFNKMQMTDKLVKEMGDTSKGVWNQIKESSQKALREIGAPALQILKPYLDKLNQALQSGKLNRFIEFGKTLAKGIARGFTNVSVGIGKWIDSIINDPQFKKLDSISAKFQFVLDDIKQEFDGWYEKDGKKTVERITTGLTDAMINSIVAATPKIAGAAIDLGIAIGSGLVDAVTNEISKSPIGSMIMGGLTGAGIGSVVPIVGPVLGGAAGAFGGLGAYGVNKAEEKLQKKHIYSKFFGGDKDKVNAIVNPPHIGGRTELKAKPKAFGLNRVPFNNYPALLHEGERVLTKQQANQSNGKSFVQIAKLADQVVFREEADMDTFINKLVKRLEEEDMNYGGVPA